jgi:hypothetical protein
MAQNADMEADSIKLSLLVLQVCQSNNRILSSSEDEEE